MSETKYGFDAGDLSLDFANTLDWHASKHPIERITSYADLLAWGKAAGLINPQTVRELRELDAHKPEETSDHYLLAIQVREAIYHIFSHHYAGKPIPEADLALLNSYVREAMSHRQLVQEGDEFHWEWSPEINGINQILWPVTFAAAHLLTSPAASRVRECEDDRGCGYLFIDQTKNHSRRWCSMESCGNRAKARRHYSRLQA